MRRLFLIFLLTLLPLQSAWAAACGYCPDNCISESAAGAQAVQADDCAEPGPDDCGACHHGGSGIVSVIAAKPVFLPLHSAGVTAGSDLSDSIERDLPERPNWTCLA